MGSKKYVRKNLIALSLGFVSLALFHSIGLAQEAEQNITFLDYCREVFQETKICPDEKCQLYCADSSDSTCQDECVPKECFKIKAKDCPKEYCQLVMGCDEKEVCFGKIQNEPEECGSLAYFGNRECCEGLVKKCGMEFLDGTCDMKSKNSIYSVPICIACGNGICNQFENNCNCPEDCS